MKRILFVCHGNICRSPMAQAVLQYLVTQRGISDWEIDSAAVSREELGHPVHSGARRMLAEHGIPCPSHTARLFTAADYDHYDRIIGMDMDNLWRLRTLCGGDPLHKCCRLLDFTATPRDVADPWYTGNFEEAFEDIWYGCHAILEKTT